MNGLSLFPYEPLQYFSSLSTRLVRNKSKYTIDRYTNYLKAKSYLTWYFFKNDLVVFFCFFLRTASNQFRTVVLSSRSIWFLHALCCVSRDPRRNDIRPGNNEQINVPETCTEIVQPHTARTRAGPFSCVPNHSHVGSRSSKRHTSHVVSYAHTDAVVRIIFKCLCDPLFCPCARETRILVQCDGRVNARACELFVRQRGTRTFSCAYTAGDAFIRTTRACFSVSHSAVSHCAQKQVSPGTNRPCTRGPGERVWKRRSAADCGKKKIYVYK